MPMLPVRFVALDSSHLAGWSRDWGSPHSSHLAAACQFDQRLAETGWVPLLSWHHLEELLYHHDLAVAEERVRFLSALPVVGWITDADGDAGFGSIVDIMSAEAAAPFGRPAASAVEVRDRARGGLIRVGTGLAAMELYARTWRDLQPYFWQRAEENRGVVAITRSKVSDPSSRRICDLLASQLRSPTDAEAELNAMMERLTQEVRDRGHKRIKDPAAVAEDFYRRVAETAVSFPSSIRAFVIEGLIIKGIEAADIGAETTLGELDDIGIFRGRLKVAAEAGDLPWPALKNQVRREQFPSWIIDRGLRLHGQDVPEHKGSELTDGHLACLAAYADLIYVDKRTKESSRRASLKSAAFASVIHRVEKAARYIDIMAAL